MAIFTREEIYKMVWDEPTMHVAKKLGITGTGLGKICMKYKIPKPPLGHWTKLTSGKKVVRFKLPIWQNGDQPQIIITPTPLDETLVSIGSGLQYKPLPKLRIPKEQHRLVKEAREFLKKACLDNYGRLYIKRKECLDIRVGPLSVERALGIYNVLIQMLQTLGNNLEIKTNRTRWEPDGTYVEIDGEEVQIYIEERSNKKILSPEEIKNRRLFYRSYEYKPDGKLILIIANAFSEKFQKQWTDGKDGTIEEKAASIINSLRIAAQLRKRRRIEDEERDRIHEEERKVREKKEPEGRLKLYRISSINESLAQIVTKDNLEKLSRLLEVSIRESDPNRYAQLVEILDFTKAYSREVDPVAYLIGKWNKS